MKVFYTYLWLREDGTPYYVGKGQGKRAYRKGHPPLDRILVQPHPSEKDAFEVEVFLISYYGRKDKGTGVLINHTDGGEGVSNISPETRLKRSIAFTGRHFTDEWKRKISVAKMGNRCGAQRKNTKHTNETRQKISTALFQYNQGHKISEETRRKLRTAHTGRVMSVESRKKVSAARKLHEQRKRVA